MDTALEEKEQRGVWKGHLLLTDYRLCLMRACNRYISTCTSQTLHQVLQTLSLSSTLNLSQFIICMHEYTFIFHVYFYTSCARLLLNVCSTLTLLQ